MLAIASDPVNSGYLWIGIIGGGVGIVIALTTYLRSFKEGAVRDGKLNTLIADENTEGSFAHFRREVRNEIVGLRRDISGLQTTLQDVVREITRNGKNTPQLGDTAARVEDTTGRSEKLLRVIAERLGIEDVEIES